MTTQVISGGEYGEKTLQYVWDPIGLAFVVMTQPGVGLGGGGAATIADGADVTQGAKADTAWDGAAAAPTGQAILKYLGAKVEAQRALLAGTLTVAGSVSVSNFPGTQAVSGTVAVSNMTAAVETGLAKDASLTTLSTAANQATELATLGSVAQAPGAYTVLERLSQIKLAVDQSVAAQRALLPKPPVVASRPTLLHR